jgi:hypothetical protein
MRNAVVNRLAACGVLLIALTLSALLIGAAPARASEASNTVAPPPSSANAVKYCHYYEQTLAARLGVTTSRLASAQESALTTTIDRAYADGTITKTQQQRMLQRASQLGTDPCAAIGRWAAMHHQKHAAANQAVVSAVASALQMQPTALSSALASGQTVPRLAASQHVSLAAVNAAYYAAVQNQLRTAVGNGTLTQSQSNAIYAKIQRAVANGRYPML